MRWRRCHTLKRTAFLSHSQHIFYEVLLHLSFLHSFEIVKRFDFLLLFPYFIWFTLLACRPISSVDSFDASNNFWFVFDFHHRTSCMRTFNGIERSGKKTKQAQTHTIWSQFVSNLLIRLKICFILHFDPLKLHQPPIGKHTSIVCLRNSLTILNYVRAVCVCWLCLVYWPFFYFDAHFFRSYLITFFIIFFFIE